MSDTDTIRTAISLGREPIEVREGYAALDRIEALLAAYQEVAAEARNWLAHDMFDAAALPNALSAAVARLDALVPAQADGE